MGRGPNVEDQFLDDLCNVQDLIKDLWRHHSELPMDSLTPAENTLFREASNCYICRKPFKYDGTLEMWARQRKELKEEMKEMEEKSRKRKLDSEDEDNRPKFIKNLFKCDIDELGPRVRDHDHFTGKFRGAAHAKCNLQMKLVKNKTVFYFHNGGKYDCKVCSRLLVLVTFFIFVLVYPRTSRLQTTLFQETQSSWEN